MILFFFLENDKKVSSKKNKLIEKLKNYYSFDDIYLLEKLYIKDEKNDLEEKFKVRNYIYEEKINILGIIGGSYTCGSIQNIILKILDNNMIYYVHEEFLIEYYNSIKGRADILNLEKIKERLEKINIK